MTDEEYINSISTMSTQNLLNNLEDFGYDNYYRDLYRATMQELKKRSCWHKVADGDLPKETSLYLCKMIYNEFYRSGYKVLLFNTMYGFYDNGLSITKDEVIAWTELPQYKE